MVCGVRCKSARGCKVQESARCWKHRGVGGGNVRKAAMCVGHSVRQADVSKRGSLLWLECR